MVHERESLSKCANERKRGERMAVDDIIEKIKKDAESQIEEMLVEAGKEADTIKEEAERTAESERNDLIKQAEKRAEEERGRIEVLARLNIKRDLLLEKQRSIDEIYEAALEKLRNLEGREHRKLYAGLIARNLENGKQTLLINEADKERVGEGFADEIRRLASKDSVDFEIDIVFVDQGVASGVLIKGSGTEIDLTIESLLGDIKADLDPQVMELMFGKEN